MSFPTVMVIILSALGPASQSYDESIEKDFSSEGSIILHRISFDCQKSEQLWKITDLQQGFYNEFLSTSQNSFSCILFSTYSKMVVTFIFWVC